MPTFISALGAGAVQTSMPLSRREVTGSERILLPLARHWETPCGGVVYTQHLKFLERARTECLVIGHSQSDLATPTAICSGGRMKVTTVSPRGRRRAAHHLVPVPEAGLVRFTRRSGARFAVTEGDIRVACVAQHFPSRHCGIRTLKVEDGNELHSPPVLRRVRSAGRHWLLLLASLFLDHHFQEARAAVAGPR